MSNATQYGIDAALDPIMALGPDTPPDAIRDYAASLARTGMDPDQINMSLAQKNIPPLDFTSRDFAQAVVANMERDTATQKAILEGNASVLSTLSLWKLRAERGDDTKLADRPRTAADYQGAIGKALVQAGIHDPAPGFVAGIEQAAVSLQLDPAMVEGIIGTAADSHRATAGMTPDQRTIFEQQQVASLESLFPAELLKAVDDEMGKIEKGFSIREAAKSGGALSAATLIHVLEARTKGAR